MNNERWCRHYQGAAYHTACKRGILYASFRDSFVRWPCINAEYAHECTSREDFTAEEIAEEERWINEVVSAFEALVAHKSDICPQCGLQITTMRQVGRCVYGSCGCRLFQGTVPDAWKE